MDKYRKSLYKKNNITREEILSMGYERSRRKSSRISSNFHRNRLLSQLRNILNEKSFNSILDGNNKQRGVFAWVDMLYSEAAFSQLKNFERSSDKSREKRDRCRTDRCLFSNKKQTRVMTSCENEKLIYTIDKYIQKKKLVRSPNKKCNLYKIEFVPPIKTDVYNSYKFVQNCKYKKV